MGVFILFSIFLTIITNKGTENDYTARNRDVKSYNNSYTMSILNLGATVLNGRFLKFNLAPY